MRWLVFFLIFSSSFAFTTVPQAELILNPDFPPVIPENITIQSKPQVIFNVLNNGTRTAYILNSSLNTPDGYIVVSAPASIKPGYTSSFVYEFNNFLCESSSSSLRFETWYEYASDLYKNLSSDDYDLSVNGFLKLQNLQPEKSDLYVDINEGEAISFLVRNDANQPVSFAFSVEYPEDFYAVFETTSLEFEKSDFESQNFFLSPKTSQLFTIQIFPSRPVSNSYFRLRLFNKDCPAISQSFEKSLNIVWVRDGALFVKNLVPDISFLQIIIIIFMAVLVFSKVYY